ncbi:MAG: zinc-binding dehydrogenase [Actinomycetota bacterium]
MKALAIESQTGVDAVKVMDVGEPEVRPGHVKVRVAAAALNHLDLWTVRGQLPFKIDFPFAIGADGAGEVVEADPETGVEVGEAVIIDPALSCGRCRMCRAGEQSMCDSFEMIGEHRSGTMAEYVVVPAANVHRYPDHLSVEQAAALGVTAITAYRMLFSRGRLQPGEDVLITGIGGGLALSALQLARPVAGRIYVTSSSSEKLRRAAALGADEGIDYTTEDVGKAIRRLTGKKGVDLVIDSAGGDTLDASMRSLRPGGRLVIAGATAGAESAINVRRLFWNQLEIIGSTMGSSDDVASMLRAVGGAKLEPIIDRVYDLADGPEAVQRLASGEQFGKLVVRIG